ncbi:hypothetical protein Tco_1562540 [Tanacetum coccineum]
MSESVALSRGKRSLSTRGSYVKAEILSRMILLIESTVTGGPPWNSEVSYKDGDGRCLHSQHSQIRLHMLMLKLQEQQDMSPFKGTQSMVVLKIDVCYEVVDTLVSMVEESKLVEPCMFVEETV